MAEQQPPQIAPNSEPFQMNYGPGIPGAELLGQDNLHLLSENLTVDRAARDGQPAYQEEGWRLNAISHDQEGTLVAHIQKPGGVPAGSGGRPKASLSKERVPLETIAALNPAPAEIDENTKPRKQLEGIQAGDPLQAAEQAVVPERGKATREVGEAAVESEAEITPVEAVQEPVRGQEELNRPELTDVFSNPARFEQVLHDPQTDPELKGQLRQLQQTWMELQLATTGDAVWDEVLSSRLQSVAEVLPNVERTSATIGQMAEEMQQGLMQLRDAMEYRDVARMQEVVSRYRFADRFDEFMTGLKRMEGADQLGEVRRRLDVDTIDADERVQKVRRGVYGEMSENDMERMVSDVQEMVAQGTNLPAIRTAFADQIKTNSPSWASRREAMETVGQFTRMTENALTMQTQRFANEYQAFVESVRAGRSDPAQADQLARVFLRDIKDQVAHIQRLARVTRTMAQQTR